MLSIIIKQEFLPVIQHGLYGIAILQPKINLIDPFDVLTMETLSIIYPSIQIIPMEDSVMKIVEMKDVQIKPNPHGVDARNLSDTANAQVSHISLKPGEFLKKHITPVDVVFYVIEGKGVVEIGEERKEVGQDTLIESPAKIPHRWINESNELVRILVIKTPKPTESTKLI